MNAQNSHVGIPDRTCANAFFSFAFCMHLRNVTYRLQMLQTIVFANIFVCLCFNNSSLSTAGQLIHLYKVFLCVLFRFLNLCLFLFAKEIILYKCI